MPEVGEIWVYDETRPYLMLRVVGNTEDRYKDSFIYFALDLLHGDSRNVEWGLYRNLWKKEV